MQLARGHSYADMKMCSRRERKRDREAKRVQKQEEAKAKKIRKETLKKHKNASAQWEKDGWMAKANQKRKRVAPAKYE